MNPNKSPVRGSNEVNVNEPVSPMATGRPKTPNLTRPGVGTGSPSTSTSALGNTTTVSATPAVAEPTRSAPLGKRESLTAAFKGLHGAGEALRGTVNSKIARGMHDTAEEERMRVVREKGVGEWRGSGLSERVPPGLREGFREKAEGRMRARRLSQGNGVHGSEGPGGLGVVEERQGDWQGR